MLIVLDLHIHHQHQSLGSKQREILYKIIANNGGTILGRTKPHFGKTYCTTVFCTCSASKKLVCKIMFESHLGTIPLPIELTHILVDAHQALQRTICDSVYATIIPDTVYIVHTKRFQSFCTITFAPLGDS